MGEKWEKFILLMWKNWLLQIRFKISTAIDILLPVMFSVLLGSMIAVKAIETYPDKFFTPFSLDSFSLDSQFIRLAYSPCGNTALDTIMNNVATKNNIIANCYTNSEELETMLSSTMNYTLAGVVFSDSLAQSANLDQNLTISLRFPSELRNTSSSPSTWSTGSMFPQYQETGPRHPESNNGASPSYFEEGYLTLQYDVSMEIIKYHADDEFIELPQIFMQRFPYPSWRTSGLQSGMESVAGLIFIWGFSSICFSTLKAITIEKEKQLKEAMKIMGLPNWLHWTAWFVKSLLLTLCSIILIVVVLTLVPSRGDTGLFGSTDVSLLFVVLVCYGCATITFSFLISVFFSKANTATTAGGLLWFLFHVVYLFIENQYDSLSLAVKLLVSLTSNSAMAFGFRIFLVWESAGQGLQWSDIFTPVSSDDSLTIGHIIIMLLIDALIYLLIAIYIEAVFPGEYGVPLVWYFPFTKTYWFGTKVPSETIQSNNLESDSYEKEPSNLNVGVQINKLTKIYTGDKIAVKDLSFNMFEGQITVLLGHNGAGKTTTMSMLTGMVTPTSGTAIINGHDIRNDMTSIRKSLGLCPQHNILFDDLTVTEHIYFYSKLKGLDKNEIQKEIDTYIQLLELEAKKDVRSKELSGGMKRKLSVAVALCGNSKICMLDEPTAGMDPASRRALWDMILKQKKGRTILLTTHFMDEADILGDRIAIMAGGELQSCGSSFFLKKRYGTGYHLIMEKSNDCNVNNVTALLRKYIPDILINTNIGSELSYTLPERYASVFEVMLNDLEKASEQLKVYSYGVSLTTMEEVFMKVGACYEENIITEAKNDINDPNSAKLNMVAQRLTGFSLIKYQYLAMLMKKFYTTFRSWPLLLIQNLIAIVMIIVAIFSANLSGLSDELPSLKTTLDAFDDAITVVVSNEPSTNSYFLQYLNILENENREVVNWYTDNITERMINQTIENTSLVRMRYIIGASFVEDSIIAWFNNIPYHSPPISLQYVINSILQQTNADYTIDFTNHPLPYSSEKKLDQLFVGMGFQLAFNLGFCMAFISPFYSLFYVKERVSKSKHLQMVSGAKISVFWIGAFTWDVITWQITNICIIIIVACFQIEGFSTASEIGWLYLILLIFSICVLPPTYLATFWFDVPTTSFSLLSIVNLFFGPMTFVLIYIFTTQISNTAIVFKIIRYIFSVVPHFSLAFSISNIHNKFSTITLCNEVSSTNNATACLISEVCCDINENYFNFDDGIGLNITYMICVAIIATILIILIEHELFNKKWCCSRKNKNISSIAAESNDSDVLEEKRKVANGEICPNDYDIVLKNLTKFYNDLAAVNNLSLGIKGYECFGLLGVNGAGKTTTFKMMTGDLVMSYGDGWIHNYNFRTDMKKARKYIGYCPQFDALLEDLTGKETLLLYCLLRGIPYKDCSYVIDQLARAFDVYKHLNKKIEDLSGGNKRKISAAIALIGDPPVVFLDEPTAGMDPATKRNLWNTLCKIRDSGKCLVLTSHSMEECEALCTRLAIMVNGEFRCLGSTQYLKNKFSAGYMIVVKVKKNSIVINNSIDIKVIDRYIKENFPSAILREAHQELLTFFIPNTSLSWSQMFGIMERAKARIANLEDYSLGQSNLEQVFLSFTKDQNGE